MAADVKRARLKAQCSRCGRLRFVTTMVRSRATGARYCAGADYRRCCELASTTKPVQEALPC